MRRAQACAEPRTPVEHRVSQRAVTGLSPFAGIPAAVGGVRYIGAVGFLLVVAHSSSVPNA